MAKLPKEVVDMANGGIFKKLARELFGYTDSQLDTMLEKGTLPNYTRPRKPRKQYLGPNPQAKDPAVVGNTAFWDRFARDHPNQIKGTGADRQIKGTDGLWHSLDEVDMAHMPTDAVTYWNNHGRFLGRSADGGPPTEVRNWMENLDNYEPQWRTQNRSEGASLSASGVRYQPPVDLERAGFTPEQVNQLLARMRQRFTVTR